MYTDQERQMRISSFDRLKFAEQRVRQTDLSGQSQLENMLLVRKKLYQEPFQMLYRQRIYSSDTKLLN
jgi:hypothetical protein